MSKFGFGEANSGFELGDLPKSKRNSKPTALGKDAIQEAEKLGFKDRSGVMESTKRKPGRKPAAERRGQVLLAGPESVIDGFKKFCIANGDVPYWEGLKMLMDRTE